MNPLVIALVIIAVGVALALTGTVLSVRASRRRLVREGAPLRMDPGLVVAVVGGVVLICGLGDLAFGLLTLQ